MRSGKLLSLEFSWGAPADAFGQHWCALWLSPMLCRALWGEAGGQECDGGCWGWQGLPPLFPPKAWYLIPVLTSEEGLKRNFSLCHSYLGFSFSDFSFTAVSLSGSIFPTILTFSFLILLFPTHLKVSSNSLCLFYINLSVFSPLVPLLSSFPSSLLYVSWSMPPPWWLGKVLLARMNAITALDNLHLCRLPLVSSQFFQLMVGWKDEGLYGLSHNLPL